MITDKDEWGNIELPGFSDKLLLNPNLNKILANKQSAKDPKWLEANKKGAKQAGKSRAQNKEWHVNLSKGAIKRQKTEEGKQHIQKMVANSNATEEWRKNHSEFQKKNLENVENNSNYKGPVIGCNIATGEYITLRGEREIKAAGFNCGNISECIKGKRNKHKGYVWTREEK